jgi:hypothetical protein
MSSTAHKLVQSRYASSLGLSNMGRRSAGKETIDLTAHGTQLK